MTSRLQVLLDDTELVEIKAAARREHMTVAEWVRQAMRVARRRPPRVTTHDKLEALRVAAEYNFPTADIDQMLSEIEQGYEDRAMS